MIFSKFFAICADEKLYNDKGKFFYRLIYPFFVIAVIFFG